MKHLFRLFSIAALSVIAVACSHDDKDDSDLIIDPVEPNLPADQAQAFYKGDIYENGTGNLWINFVCGVQYDAELDEMVGPGFILCLDFNTALAQNPDMATLSTGKYTGSPDDESHALYTLNLADGESYLAEYDANGNDTEYDFAAGTVTVSTLDNGDLSIQAEMVLDDEKQTVRNFIFRGKLSVVNRSGEGEMSNLTGSVTLTDLTQGSAIYFGETFTESSDLYAVILAGPDYDLDENYGKSPAIMISFNVTPGANDGIPSGVYEVINATEADDYEPNTLLSGVYEPSYGGYFGTWYFSTSPMLEAAVKSGQITVTNSGDGLYTFIIDCKDGYGNSITGMYTGTVEVDDASDW